MPLIVFTERKFVADFLQEKCDFTGKTADLLFLSLPLGELWATYDDHLRLIGKRVAVFLLVLIELFSLDVTAEALRAKIDRKSAISFKCCQFDPKFQVEGDVLHQSFLHG